MPADENSIALRRLLEHLAILSQFARQVLGRDEDLNKHPEAGVSETNEPAPPGKMPVSPKIGYGKMEEAFRRFFLDRVTAEVRENEYKTNDLVELTGGFNSAERHLKINGVPPIHLTKPEFVLFLFLDAHARSRKGLESPRRIEGGKFLGADDILRAIDAWREEEARLQGFWASATFTDVHRTVCKIRGKIQKVGANPNIIETGPKGEGGYRLSTSPYNVTITLR